VTRRLEVAPDAQADIDDLLRFSESRFGAGAADRYRLLINAAIADLLVDPQRPASYTRDDIPPGIRLYALRHSRTRLPSARRITRPRHLIAYRYDPDRLEFVRVLYDSMDLPAWLGSA
jgi:toxin ParE1/3/4